MRLPLAWVSVPLCILHFVFCILYFPPYLLLRRSTRQRRFQFLDDQLVEPGPAVLGAHGQSVLDGPVSGAAVADDTDAINAQQRGAAEGAVVVAVDQVL